MLGTIFNLSPYGKVNIKEIIHTGSMFNVYLAELFGNEICLKSPSLNANNEDLFRSNFHGVQTSFYVGSTSEFTDQFKTDISNDQYVELLGRLLIAEGEVIKWSNGAWNHSVLGQGLWDRLSNCYKHAFSEPLSTRTSDPESLTLRFAPVLILPSYSAIPLSSLSPDKKRELFPRMLPALWEALCEMHHGDLSEDNILVERNFKIIRLIDPGIAISSAITGDLYANMVSFFTTTAANYPLIPPFVDFGENVVEDYSDSLINHLKALLSKLKRTRGEACGVFKLAGRELTWSSDRTLCRVKRKRPISADILSLGIIYYRILTQKDLFKEWGLAPDKPAWQGQFGEVGGDNTVINQYERVIEQLSGKHLEEVLNGASLRQKERHLVNELINLRIRDKEDLLKLL
jgi:serine/threonine protein kinase